MKFVLTAEGQDQRGLQCCPVAVPRQGCKGRDDRDCALGLCSQAGMVFISRYLTVAAFVSFLTPPDRRGHHAPRSPTTFSEHSHVAARFPFTSISWRAQPFSTAPENIPG